MAKQLIITGFHRSGTSLSAHYLMKCGLFIGDELINATPDNRYGHFEDVEPLFFHEGVFSRNSLNWMITEEPTIHLSDGDVEWMREFADRRNSQHDLWGFKDPRACFFIDKWKDVVPDSKILVLFRNPCACVASLSRRHARQITQNKGVVEEHKKFFIEPDYALRMWCAHNTALIKFYRNYKEDMIFLNHEKLANDFALSKHLNKYANLGLGDVMVSSIFDPGVTQGAMQPLLVHDKRWITEAIEIWRNLAEIESRTLFIENRETAKELTESSFHHSPALATLKRRKDLCQSVCMRPGAKLLKELKNLPRSVSRRLNLKPNQSSAE